VSVFFALDIQHAKSMRRIVLSSVACLAVLYFFTLPQMAKFSGKKLLSIKCVFAFPLQLASKVFLILKNLQRDIIINLPRLSCRVPATLFRTEVNSKYFQKNNQVTNFTKIRPAGVELFHSDGQADRCDEANCGSALFF